MIRKKDNGYYTADDIVEFTRMTPEEERDLFIRYQQKGDLVARDALVCNHLLFVAGVAARCTPAWGATDEAISAGNAALFKALDKFNPERGVRFTSYLQKFVRGEVIRCCREKAPVHFPSSQDIPPAVAWEDSDELPEGAVGAVEISTPAQECEESDRLRWMRDALAKAFTESSASDIEIHVITQLFLEGRTLQQVAQELPQRLGKSRLSRQRIFQIKNKALARLKASLARQGIRGLE